MNKIDKATKDFEHNPASFGRAPASWITKEAAHNCNSAETSNTWRVKPSLKRLGERQWEE